MARTGSWARTHRSGPSRWIAAGLAVLALVGAPSAARASCAPSDPFAEASRAPRVAIVRAAASSQQFQARLVIEKVLKGPARPAAVTVSFNPLAGASFQPGRRYLVFFQPDGTLVGGCATVDLGDARGRGLADAVRDWLGASTARAQTAILVQIGTRRPTSDVEAQTSALALRTLGASPALVADVNAAERAALVGAVSTAQGESAHALAWVLARLRATESMPAWIALLGARPPVASARVVQDALELMTNRHDPAYTPGHDVHGAEADALRAGWTRWQQQNAGRPAQGIVIVGARERGAVAPLLHDRASLAATVRSEKDELTRKVALAACEQLVRAPTSLVGDHSQAMRVDWSRAVAVCSPPPAPIPPR